MKIIPDRATAISAVSSRTSSARGPCNYPAWFERSRARRRSAKRGMRPVLGTLDDAEIIARAAREADAVVDTAEANHAGVVEAITSALRGSGKPFLHTSGSGIVATVTNRRTQRLDLPTNTPALRPPYRACSSGPRSTRPCSMRAKQGVRWS